MLDDGSVGVLIAVAKDSCKVLTNKVSIPPHSRGCYPCQRPSFASHMLFLTMKPSC